MLCSLFTPPAATRCLSEVQISRLPLPVLKLLILIVCVCLRRRCACQRCKHAHEHELPRAGDDPLIRSEGQRKWRTQVAPQAREDPQRWNAAQPRLFSFIAGVTWNQPTRDLQNFQSEPHNVESSLCPPSTALSCHRLSLWWNQTVLSCHRSNGYQPAVSRPTRRSHTSPDWRNMKTVGGETLVEVSNFTMKISLFPQAPFFLVIDGCVRGNDCISKYIYIYSDNDTPP